MHDTTKEQLKKYIDTEYIKICYDMYIDGANGGNGAGIYTRRDVLMGISQHFNLGDLVKWNTNLMIGKGENLYRIGYRREGKSLILEERKIVDRID